MTEDEYQAAARGLAVGDLVHMTYESGETSLVQLEGVPTRAGERLDFLRVDPEMLLPVGPMLGFGPELLRGVAKATLRRDAWQAAALRLSVVLRRDEVALEAMLALIRTCRADTSLALKPLVSLGWLRFEVPGRDGFVCIEVVGRGEYDVLIRDADETFEVRRTTLSELGGQLRAAEGRARTLLRPRPRT